MDISGNENANIAKERHAFVIYEVQLQDMTNTNYKSFIPLIKTSIAWC